MSVIEAVLIGGGAGFVVGLLQHVIRQWWRDRNAPSLDEWLDAADPDREMRELVTRAIYTEAERWSGHHGLTWVMSQEWFDDIRALLFVPAGYSALNFANWKRQADQPWLLLGRPMEVREGAGFPKLVEQETGQHL